MYIQLTIPMRRLLRMAKKKGGNMYFKDAEKPAVDKLCDAGLCKLEKNKKGLQMVFTKMGHDVARRITGGTRTISVDDTQFEKQA